MAYWLNKDSRKFLSRGYIVGDRSAEERMQEIADKAEEYLGIEGFGAKFLNYLYEGYYSLASPIWANFGIDRGLPISCNGSFISDTLESILHKSSEVGKMTKEGAGTAAYFGALRKRGSEIRGGGTSSGPVHFMQLYDRVVDIVSQSNVRRGSMAAYLDIEHPDIMEFLEIREDGHIIQDLQIGVCIGDEWMKDLKAGKASNRRVWERIVKKRFETGFPYLFFRDTANNNAPEVYKEQGLKIPMSNLCSEIFLSCDEENSFVCCLSSMNLLHYDKWKDTDAVEVLTYFLDAVMSEYIIKTESMPDMKTARNFAINQRAIGIGVLGWHSFLQSNMIPFESLKAKSYTTQIFTLLHERTLQASKELAQKFGEPPLLVGKGRRNATLMAIAPTKSSAFILGQVSESVEPYDSNYFTKDLAKGSFTFKNPYLDQLLTEKGCNNEKIWKSILKNAGSVAHLIELSDYEKEVFKTFEEISQYEVILQASIRQKYIDQGQSLNLKIVGAKDEAEMKKLQGQVSKLLFNAWEMGLKSLYYQHNVNPSQQLSRSTKFGCSSCEG